MLKKIAKTAISTMALLLSGGWVYAQQPDSEELSQEELRARDSIMFEAFVDGGLDYRVFGKYARNDDLYRQLTERFEQNDETLSGSGYLILYYGYAYRDEYGGGYSIPGWDSLIEEGRYGEAYERVCDALKTAPATPNYLATAIQLASRVGRPRQEISGLAWRLYNLLSWIHATGDGTEDYPWKVVNVVDEYTFMRYMLEVESINEQSLVTNRHGVQCDVMEVEPVDNEMFSGSEIWFDVSFPIIMLESPGYWAEQLSEDGVQAQQPQDLD